MSNVFYEETQLAGSMLIGRMTDERKNMRHTIGKAWLMIKKLSNKPTQYLVTTNQVAHQLLANKSNCHVLPSSLEVKLSAVFRFTHEDYQKGMKVLKNNKAVERGNVHVEQLTHKCRLQSRKQAHP